NQGIFVHDNGVIVDANEALAKMTGYPVEEMVGRKDFLFWEPKAADLIAKFKVEGYPTHPYEVTIRRKDGTFFSAEVQGRDFSWGGKNLRVVNLLDITERKKSEQALRESEERFKKFAEVTVEGIMIHEKGIIADVNQTLLNMLG